MSLPLEPCLSRSFPLRTVPTMLALTAFYLSRSPALHRAARVSTSLAPTPMLSLPLAAAPLRRCGALFCLPSLSPHPATGLPQGWYHTVRVPFGIDTIQYSGVLYGIAQEAPLNVRIPWCYDIFKLS